MFRIKNRNRKIRVTRNHKFLKFYAGGRKMVNFGASYMMTLTSRPSFHTVLMFQTTFLGKRCREKDGLMMSRTIL